MRLDTNLKADAFGYKSAISGQFTSGIRYIAPRLYLNDLQPVDLNIQTGQEEKDELSEIKSATKNFLKRQKDRVATEGAEKLLDKIVGETDEDFEKTLINVTYWFVETIPLYDLNDAGYKGNLASLALKDIQFHEDHAVITLSPSQAAAKILMGIGIAILAILYLLNQLGLLGILLPKSWRGKTLIDYVDDNRPRYDPSKRDDPHNYKIISGFVDVPEEDRADFDTALPEHHRLTNAEPGCVYFRVTPDSEVAGRYQVEEAFINEAAFQKHIKRTRETNWAHVTRNINRSYSRD